MNENDIIMENLEKQLFSLKLQRQKEELEAAIDLFYLKYFKSALLQFIKEENISTIKLYNKEKILNTALNYDMRKHMDSDLIADITSMGYRYLPNYSDNNTLCFEKIKEL